MFKIHKLLLLILSLGVFSFVVTVAWKNNSNLLSEVITKNIGSEKRILSPQENTERKSVIRIEGHRAAGHLAPENSRKAFEKAIKLGIDGVEFDIWLTKDKVPVVVHALGGGLVEFANHTKIIHKINYETLMGYTLSNGERVLSLANVLDICQDRINLNIEFKDPNEEVVGRVLDMLIEKDMLDQVTFSSFHHSLRKTLTKEIELRHLESASLNFGFLMHIFKVQFPDYEHTPAGDSINLDIRFLLKHKEKCLAEIEKARKHNMKIIFWFPLIYKNEEKNYKKLMNLEIDTIISNQPDLLIKYFEENKGIKY